ncbi:MAG: hypothetical protein IJ627_03170 [Bacteroidales bacterium]|nr:hypothetical protein [Bacteroidales bacterium]
MIHDKKNKRIFITAEEVERAERQAEEARRQAEQMEAMLERQRALQRLSLWSPQSSGKKYMN